MIVAADSLIETRICFSTSAVLVVSVLLMPFAASGQTAPSPPLVMACAPCHGFDGTGHDGNVPNLAGQHPGYLYNQLLAFRSGQRIHPQMSFFATQFTREELEEIVAYYAGLRPP